ncbi:hypothetical protein MA16_Dca022805 [Dendrobium catenatum]|uniref:Uncharacterized protein n=1 Tax=Dendrobium catenatum TaxID=906689 RepID=A0A2I0W7R4_9ASPA|nr:hypothetical protein MA16_Dca022805 [Dendrobium catenatum]
MTPSSLFDFIISQKRRDCTRHSFCSFMVVRLPPPLPLEFVSFGSTIVAQLCCFTEAYRVCPFLLFSSLLFSSIASPKVQRLHGLLLRFHHYLPTSFASQEV